MTMYGSNINVGTPVMTADGKELGKVKEVSGTCFKVDAPMQPDYWLGSDLASTMTGGIIHLTIDKEMLGEAKMDSPDHTGYHRHDN
jgi:hypothetical protein